MARVPTTHVPLGEALIMAACTWYSEEFTAAGLTSDQAAAVLRFWMARNKDRDSQRPINRNLSFPKGIPIVLTKEDRNNAVPTPEIRELSEHARPLHHVPGAAWDRLRDLLAAGQLVGEIFSEADGRPHKVPAHTWNHEDADTAHERGRMRLAYGMGSLIGPVAIRKLDLQNAISGGAAAPEAPAGSAPVPTQASETRRNPGGAPARFSREDFLILAAKLLYEGLNPKTQAELRKAALDAYSSTLPKDDEPPSDEWAKPIIRKLWNSLELQWSG
jgi:hypothetical protein